MKTIDEILEGVTARGKWRQGPSAYILWAQQPMDQSVGRLDNSIDGAFAARAASNFEPMARVLESIEGYAIAARQNRLTASEASVTLVDISLLARAALAEALKD